MQLVAYGAQDIYLTGNPQITFFKVVYRRHTNFSMECIKQTFTGTPQVGTSATATISRNGDLVSGMYLVFNPSEVVGKAAASTQTAKAAFLQGDETSAIGIASNVGFALINEVDIEIGGQRIDRQFGKWMNVWSDLTSVNPSCSKGYINRSGEYGNNSSASNDRVDVAHPLNHNYTRQLNGVTHVDGYSRGIPTQSQKTSFNVGSSIVNKREIKITQASVPLQFWFCRNPGLALPLIALQYHEVKVRFSFIDNLAKISSKKEPTNAATGDGASVSGNLSSLELWADYIYLDTDERRRFAQVSHEYLIEQIQYQSYTSNAGGNFDLNFNHPVKELIWAGTPNSNSLEAITDNNQFDGVFSLQGPSVPRRFDIEETATWTLKLNGHERFAPRNSGYFTGTQVDNHHSGNSGIMIPESIYVYSFALKPEEHQPSGTCNFSRIDNARLICNDSGVLSGAQMDVYAVNYNVLRIMSGMGGLAYSN